MQHVDPYPYYNKLIRHQCLTVDKGHRKALASGYTNPINSGLTHGKSFSRQTSCSGTAVPTIGQYIFPLAYSLSIIT